MAIHCLWDGTVWDERTGQWVPNVERRRSASGPNVWSDLPGYKSPVGTGWIEGRRARREDLARSGCREVDPSEFKPEIRNPAFAAKRGLRVTADPLPMPQRPVPVSGPLVLGIPGVTAPARDYR